jgi:hypothetical protein
MTLTRRTTLLTVFSVCVLLEGLLCVWFQGPAVVSTAAAERMSADAAFSSERACELHAQIFPDEPHPAGSAANELVRSRIEAHLRSMGWTVDDPTPGDAPKNIVASHPDLVDLQQRPLILASHYDSCPQGPGAGDAGGCVVAVLEAARILSSGSQHLRRPVWVLLTDAEESGLLGARHFCETHPLRNQQPIVLNFDARGNAGPVVMFETHTGNLEMIDRFANKLARPRLTGSLFTTIYRMLPNDTDFTVFSRAGFEGFNFALIDGAWNYHRPTDALENLDRRSVQHLGQTALSLATAIATADQEVQPSAADALFLDVLGLHVLVIPRTWLFPLRFAILFLGVQLYGRPLMKSRQWKPVLMVWATMALQLPFAALLGWVVSQSLLGTQVLPRAFVPHGHWLSLGMWVFCLLCCCQLSLMMLRNIERRCLWNSFWLAHAFTTMLVASFAAEFSYLLWLPALFAIAATLLLQDTLVRTAIVSVLCCLLLIPLHHLMAIGLGPAAGMFLFPAFALIVMPIMPCLGKMDEKRPATIREAV